ncbi:PstS family phosphate ABC transporter substrate-binding protein [Sphingomonas gilva]|uniref:PstS family phosphate ABC transporter substrate-binding protein n=1 Tax=Sphingomonas gilva TaxID=2305907 RepID=UPI001CA3DFC1|nr:substrate-binding domain-containing protein [Sphingomonas gilva]
MAQLPTYVAQQQVSGSIRSYGFGLGGVLERWQAAFKKLHPGVTFDNTLPTSDAAFPALVTNVTDLAPNGGEPAITEWLSFYETHGYHASSVVVATGAFDVKSRSNGPVIFVHKDNPIERLTIDQLDGIFGAQRTGGMEGFVWTPRGARGPEKNIRTWGQLGLTGEWADKPIQTYGHASSGTTRFFQLHVLENTDKWNPNYRGYVETGSKMIAAEDTGQTLGIQHMLRNELAKDRFGIAWTIMSQVEGISELKPVAIAPRGSTNYVAPSRATFQDRSYPLARKIYIYFDRPPGKALEPKLKEFLRFVLSREGQRLVGEGGYLPLPAQFAGEQRASLD